MIRRSLDHARAPRWATRVAVATCLLAVASEARAQPVDEATRASARRLGEEATELFAKGEYQAALDKYERADALVHVPTLGVRQARCLEKLGRLVEAAERYVAVTRMQLPADALPVHREALADAERELTALRPRIPSLVIELARGSEGEVTIDGARVPAALLGQKRAVDPGRRRIELRRGAVVVSRDVDVREGDVLTVALEAPRSADPPPPPSPASDPPGRGVRIAGAVILGAGGAAMLAGAITGGLVLAQRGDLESRCGPQLACPPSAWSDADAYNRLRIVSTSTLVAGAVLAAGGTVLLVAAPRSPARASVSPWIGAGQAGIRGHF